MSVRSARGSKRCVMATNDNLNNFSKQENKSVTLWEIDVFPGGGESGLAGGGLGNEARDLGLGEHLKIVASRGFLLQGDLNESQVQLAARQLLADAVTESLGEIETRTGLPSCRLPLIARGIDGPEALRRLAGPLLDDPGTSHRPTADRARATR